MKNLLKSSLIITLFGGLIFLIACESKQNHAEAGGYFCPMHPTVESATPGVCPVCNMELVAKVSQVGGKPLNAEELAAAESPVNKIFARVRTVRGSYTEHHQVIKANGVITQDNRFVQTLTTRFSGRLEQVYVNANLEPVKKGQVLATVYSQELLEAQQNFLNILKNNGDPLLQAAKEQLAVLGFTQEMIESILNSGKVIEHFPITSSVHGYLIQSDQQNTERLSLGGMMGGQSKSIAVSKKSSGLKKGDYVNAGQELFTVLEKNGTRLDINLREVDAALVKIGQRIRGKTSEGKVFEGVIGLIDFASKEDENFRKARVYLKNTDFSLGALVEVEIQTGSEEGLWLPKSATLNLGDRVIVFLKKEDHFVVREVITGNVVDRNIRVIKGLTTSDEVAEQAGLLADSDTFVATENNRLPGEPKPSSEQLDSKHMLMMDDRAIQLAGVKMVEVIKKEVKKEWVFNGRVNADPEKNQVISSRIPGRITRLNYRETGRPIKKGEVIAEVHSPEIQTIISELKLSLKQGEPGASLVVASKNKLERYGLTKSQIEGWIKTERIPETISIQSEVSGTLTEIMVSPGQIIGEGSPLMTVSNLSELWVETEIYPGEEWLFRNGSTATISLSGSEQKNFSATVEQVVPSYRDGTQTAWARLRIRNSNGNIRPGQLARITMTNRKKESLMVPTGSVIETGTIKKVFVYADQNSFTERIVHTGLTEDGMIEILSGLSGGEWVVEAGAYLLNSQMILRNN